MYITKTRQFKYLENFTSILKRFRKKKKTDIFYISAKTASGYSLESPRRGGSNEYRQSMFLSKNIKKN